MKILTGLAVASMGTPNKFTFFDAVGLWLSNAFNLLWIGINTFAYFIIRFVLNIVDFLQFFCQKLVGIDYWMSGNVSRETLGESDIIFRFMFSEPVQRVFRLLVGVFAVLLIVFTIVAIVKNEYDYLVNPDREKADKIVNSKAGVFRESLRAIALVILMPLMIVMGVLASNAILASLVNAFNLDNRLTIGSQVFAVSAYNANRYRVYANTKERQGITNQVYVNHNGGMISIRTSFEPVNPMYYSSSNGFNGYLVRDRNDNKEYLYEIEDGWSPTEFTDTYRKFFESFDFELRSVLTNADINEGGSGDQYVVAAHNTWGYNDILNHTKAWDETLIKAFPEESEGVKFVSDSGRYFPQACYYYNSEPWSNYHDGGKDGLVTIPDEYYVMADIIDFMVGQTIPMSIVKLTNPRIDWTTLDKDGRDFVSRDFIRTENGVVKSFVVDYTESGMRVYNNLTNATSESEGALYIMCYRDASSNKYVPVVNGRAFIDAEGNEYEFESDYLDSNYHGIIVARGLLDAHSNNYTVGTPCMISSVYGANNVSVQDPKYVNVVGDDSYYSYLTKYWNSTFNLATDFTGLNGNQLNTVYAGDVNADIKLDELANSLPYYMSLVALQAGNDNESLNTTIQELRNIQWENVAQIRLSEGTSFFNKTQGSVYIFKTTEDILSVVKDEAYTGEDHATETFQNQTVPLYAFVYIPATASEGTDYGVDIRYAYGEFTSEITGENFNIVGDSYCEYVEQDGTEGTFTTGNYIKARFLPYNTSSVSLDTENGQEYRQDTSSNFYIPIKPCALIGDVYYTLERRTYEDVGSIFDNDSLDSSNNTTTLESIGDFPIMVDSLRVLKFIRDIQAGMINLSSGKIEKVGNAVAPNVYGVEGSSNLETYFGSLSKESGVYKGNGNEYRFSETSRETIGDVLNVDFILQYRQATDQSGEHEWTPFFIEYTGVQGYVQSVAVRISLDGDRVSIMAHDYYEMDAYQFEKDKTKGSNLIQYGSAGTEGRFIPYIVSTYNMELYRTNTEEIVVTTSGNQSKQRVDVLYYQYNNGSQYWTFKLRMNGGELTSDSLTGKAGQKYYKIDLNYYNNFAFWADHATKDGKDIGKVLWQLDPDSGEVKVDASNNAVTAEPIRTFDYYITAEKVILNNNNDYTGANSIKRLTIYSEDGERATDSNKLIQLTYKSSVNPQWTEEAEITAALENAYLYDIYSNGAVVSGSFEGVPHFENQGEAQSSLAITQQIRFTYRFVNQGVPRIDVAITFLRLFSGKLRLHIGFFNGVSEDQEKIMPPLFVGGEMKLTYNFDSINGLNINTFYYTPNIEMIVLIFATILIMSVLGKAVWGLIQRIYNIVLYFLVMPGIAATIPLGNDRFKSWKDNLIKQVLSAYGTLIGLNFFIILMPMIRSVSKIFTAADIQSGLAQGNWISSIPVSWLNELVYLLFMLVALTLIRTLPGLLSGIIQGKDAVDVYKTGGEVFGNVKDSVERVGSAVSGNDAVQALEYFVGKSENGKRQGGLLQRFVPGSALFSGGGGKGGKKSSTETMGSASSETFGSSGMTEAIETTVGDAVESGLAGAAPAAAAGAAAGAGAAEGVGIVVDGAENSAAESVPMTRGERRLNNLLAQRDRRLEDQENGGGGVILGARAQHEANLAYNAATDRDFEKVFDDKDDTLVSNAYDYYKQQSGIDLNTMSKDDEGFRAARKQAFDMYKEKLAVDAWNEQHPGAAIDTRSQSEINNDIRLLKNKKKAGTLTQEEAQTLVNLQNNDKNRRNAIKTYGRQQGQLKKDAAVFYSNAQLDVKIAEARKRVALEREGLDSLSTVRGKNRVTSQQIGRHIEEKQLAELEVADAQAAYDSVAAGNFSMDDATRRKIVANYNNDKNRTTATFSQLSVGEQESILHKGLLDIRSKELDAAQGKLTVAESNVNRDNKLILGRGARKRAYKNLDNFVAETAGADTTSMGAIAQRRLDTATRNRDQAQTELQNMAREYNQKKTGMERASAGLQAAQEAYDSDPTAANELALNNARTAYTNAKNAYDPIGRRYGLLMARVNNSQATIDRIRNKDVNKLAGRYAAYGEVTTDKTRRGLEQNIESRTQESEQQYNLNSARLEAHMTTTRTEIDSRRAQVQASRRTLEQMLNSGADRKTIRGQMALISSQERDLDERARYYQRLEVQKNQMENDHNRRTGTSYINLNARRGHENAQRITAAIEEQRQQLAKYGPNMSQVQISAITSRIAAMEQTRRSLGTFDTKARYTKPTFTPRDYGTMTVKEARRARRADVASAAGEARRANAAARRTGAVGARDLRTNAADARREYVPTQDRQAQQAADLAVEQRKSWISQGNEKVERHKANSTVGKKLAAKGYGALAYANIKAGQLNAETLRHLENEIATRIASGKTRKGDRAQLSAVRNAIKKLDRIETNAPVTTRDVVYSKGGKVVGFSQLDSKMGNAIRKTFTQDMAKLLNGADARKFGIKPPKSAGKAVEAAHKYKQALTQALKEAEKRLNTSDAAIKQKVESEVKRLRSKLTQLQNVAEKAVKEAKRQKRNVDELMRDKRSSKYKISGLVNPDKK